MSRLTEIKVFMSLHWKDYVPSRGLSSVSSISPLPIFILLFSVALIFRYLYLWLVFYASRSTTKSSKVPPTIPYMIPLLGSSFQLGFNALEFVQSSLKLLGNHAPFHVAVPGTNLYFLQGAENIAFLWKHSGSMTGTPLHLFCLKYLFGMPQAGLDIYARDDSGVNTQPLAGSHVAPYNRVDFRTHAGLLEFTNGKGLEGFYTRWATGFSARLQALDIHDGWVEMPDFMQFFDDCFGSALVESICGPALTRINPHFARDFSKYDMMMPGLLKGLPRWIIPDAYEVRDKLIASIREWHSFARKQFKELEVGADGDADPYWGSLFIRERQKSNGIFSTIDNFDHDACASSDLGFVWAANTNLVPSAMWCSLEVFKDPSLLVRVRRDLETVGSYEKRCKPDFDIRKLLALPLLQSIYAETLRLRVRAYAARYTDTQELHLNGWIFPRRSAILVSTTPAHMDESFWNTRAGEFPTDQFWSDRFLVYPGDSQSGPQKPSSHDSKASSLTSEVEPKFSMTGTNGHWLPYGGGPRVCIGRAFSKRAIMTTCSMLVTLFDVEILADKPDLQMDPKYYGLGGQRPVGKVRFKVRKRRLA